MRTSILRSKAESIENTPTNNPAGGNESKLTGGNGGSIMPVVAGTGYADKDEDVSKSGGVDEGGGTEQYARHGRGSLSGLRI